MWDNITYLRYAVNRIIAIKFTVYWNIFQTIDFIGIKILSQTTPSYNKSH